MINKPVLIKSIFISVLSIFVVTKVLTLFPKMMSSEPSLLNLNGNWKICYPKDIESRSDECTWSDINIPFVDKELIDVNKFNGILFFKKKITEGILFDRCHKEKLCSFMFSEVGDAAQLYINNTLIHEHGKLHPDVKYKKHYPIKAVIPSHILKNGKNIVLMKVSTLKKSQLGIRGNLNAVYLNSEADDIEKRLIFYNIGLPLLGAFGCFLISLFVILCFNSWVKAGAPKSLLTRLLSLAVVTGLYFVSFSEIPREFFSLGFSGFSHFFLRLSFDYSFFEFVICLYNLNNRKIAKIRYLYWICLLAFVTSYTAPNLMGLIFGSSFDMAHFLMRVFFPLLLIPVLVGIYESLKKNGPVLNDFCLMFFIILLPMEINDILVFHGYLANVYFVKFYPFVMTFVFTILLLEVFKKYFASKLLYQEKLKSSHDLMELTS